MPFRSLAQERYLFAKHPEVAAKFAADSGGHMPANLPDHVQHAPGATPSSPQPASLPQVHTPMAGISAPKVHGPMSSPKHLKVSSPWMAMTNLGGK